MDSFNEELANILDVQRVNGSDQLRSFENWDSLSILSICAMIDTKFGVSLNAADLQSMNTVEDLATFVTSRASR